MDKKMKEYGKKIWFIPDGEVPDPNEGKLFSHEAVILLNPNKRDAAVVFTFYFRDEEKISNIKIKLEAEKMIDIHLNNQDELPVKLDIMKPYSLKIESNVGIVVQHSRLVSVKDCFSLFTTIPFSQE